MTRRSIQVRPMWRQLLCAIRLRTAAGAHRVVAAATIGAALLTSCIANSPEVGWVIPTETALAGATIVEYDAAPPWDDGTHCAGALRPGAEALGERLHGTFPQIARVFGYDCRPNTAIPNELSEHGTGRAIDLAIPTRDGEADNELGDPVANWLIEHSAELGVQLIIWDRTIWLGDQPLPKERPYSGPDPHVDHIHVELTEAAATG